MMSGCSCFRNLGTAALMKSVSLTSVTMKASTVTSRAAQRIVRNSGMYGAGVLSAGAAAAADGEAAAGGAAAMTAGGSAAADPSAAAIGEAGSRATAAADSASRGAATTGKPRLIVEAA